MEVGLINEFYFSHTQSGFIYTNLIFKNGDEQKIRWNFGYPNERWRGSSTWYVMSGKSFFFNQLNKEQQIFLRKKVVDWLAKYKNQKDRCGFHMNIIEENGMKKLVSIH
jgi:hypothetical protein